MATLAEIREKLKSQVGKNAGDGKRNFEKSSFPFWDANENTTSLVRFLPDGNPDNTFFWVERQVIRIPFEGIKDQDMNRCTVQVPCMHMFGKSDYIIDSIKSWWDDPNKEAAARAYWKKRAYIFQGFVTSPAEGIDFNESERYEVKKFVINPSIFEIIKSALMDPEMEDSPVDYIAGRDFKIVKTRKDNYANYSTSSWSIKTRSLEDKELEVVTEGLKDLSENLPHEPSQDALEAIRGMFKDSVDGQPYDPDKYSKFYTPFGFKSNAVDAPTTSDNGNEVTEKLKRAALDTSTNAMTADASETEATNTGEKSAQDILKMIRERQK